MRTRDEIWKDLENAAADRRMIDVLSDILADHESRIPTQPRAAQPVPVMCKNHPVHLEGECPHDVNDVPCFCFPSFAQQPAPTAMPRLEAIRRAAGDSDNCAPEVIRASRRDILEAARADLADAVADATKADKARIAELEQELEGHANQEVSWKDLLSERNAKVAELEVKLAEAEREREAAMARIFPGATLENLQGLTRYLNEKQYPQLHAGQDVAGAALQMIQHFELEASVNAQAARDLDHLRKVFFRWWLISIKRIQPRTLSAEDLKSFSDAQDIGDQLAGTGIA